MQRSVELQAFDELVARRNAMLTAGVIAAEIQISSDGDQKIEQNPAFIAAQIDFAVAKSSLRQLISTRDEHYTEDIIDMEQRRPEL